MPNVKLSEGYVNLQDGRAQIIKITRVRYDEDFDIIRVYFVDPRGATHNERYQIGKDNKYRKQALNAFSALAKAALNDYTAKDIDPLDLEGKFVQCDVYSTESEKQKGRTFAHITNLQPTDETFEEIDIDDDEDDDDEDWV